MPSYIRGKALDIFSEERTRGLALARTHRNGGFPFLGYWWQSPVITRTIPSLYFLLLQSSTSQSRQHRRNCMASITLDPIYQRCSNLPIEIRKSLTLPLLFPWLSDRHIIAQKLLPYRQRIKHCIHAGLAEDRDRGTGCRETLLVCTIWCPISNISSGRGYRCCLFRQANTMSS